MCLSACHADAPHNDTDHICYYPEGPLFHEGQGHESLCDYTENSRCGILERLRIPEVPEDESPCNHNSSTPDGEHCALPGSLTPFSKTKQFYLLIDFLLKVFFLSNLIRIFVALYGTIAL